MSMPSKAEIFKYWKDWLNESQSNWVDWGEPSCWACGKWWGTNYDLNKPNLSLDEICKNWNRVRELQRCHIIPRSLGGTDEPSNLFLMCKECHDHAPNTTSRKMFMKWVEKQNWWKRWQIKVEEEIETFDLNPNEYNEIIEILMSAEFKRWSRENTGLHWNQKGYGVKLTLSTLLVAAIEYRNKIK